MTIRIGQEGNQNYLDKFKCPQCSGTNVTATLCEASDEQPQRWDTFCATCDIKWFIEEEVKIFKYKIPVEIHAYASYCIGSIECDSLEEFKEKSEELWESQENDAPDINSLNNFDLSDWEISELKEDDLVFFAKD